ncbi:MAG: hypothetical protein KC478_04825 [Bacteriovoracaceae bacterium]|nr:hypothetical protein [Bacteriovoracaceae bacterium]
MKLIAMATLLMCSLAGAAELKIDAFYYLDGDSRTDKAAEICFSLTPAPQNPVFAQVTIDKGSNTEGWYNAFIGPRGKTCVVVSTWRGLGEVTIPQAKLSVSKSASSKK